MKNFNLLSKMCSPLVGPQSSEVSLDRRLTVGSPSVKYCLNLLRLVAISAFLLTIGVGNAWGTLSSPYECTFTSGMSMSDGQVTTGDVTWTVTTTKGKGSPSISFGNQNGQSCIKFGAGKDNYYSSMTLTTSAFSSCNVSSVVLYISSNNGGSKTVTVSQGATTIGTGSQSFSSTTWVTNCTRNTTAGSGGNLSVTISSDATATFVHSIKVTYTASCSGTDLDAPDVSAVPSSGRITLSWPNDANASSYTVSCKNASSGAAAGSVGTITGTTTKTCAITSLSNGTEYTWTVIANGNGTTYCNSDPASANAIPGTYYTVTFMNNGSTYDTKSLLSGSHLVLPDNPSSCDDSKEFVGWSTNNIGSTPTDTKPTTFKSTFSTISGNTTLYAVFAKKTANSYKLGDANDLIEGQKVLIVNQNAAQAMSNTNNTGKLTATGVTISSSTISSPAASLIWTVELDGTKYKFKNTYYVYAYSTSSIYCDDDDATYTDSWTLTYASSAGKYYMHSDRSTSSYRLQYYSSNFKLYTSNTTEIFKQSFFIPTYTKYVTTCASCDDPAAPTNGSVYGTTATITVGTSGDYNIYYSTSSSAPSKATAGTTTIDDGTSANLTSLAYGTTYYYWAQKDCGGGSTSNYVAGSPTSFTTTIPEPSGVSAGSLSMNGATFTITDANNVNNYDIYYSEDDDTPVAGTAATTTSDGKTKVVTGLKSGTTYYYWVRAKGPNAKSDWVGGSTFTTLTLKSISVSTAPTKTKYLVGDNFDPTGLIIRRTFSDDTYDTYTYAGHTAEFSFDPSTSLTSGTSKAITITYGGKTTTTNVDVYTVTVNKVNMGGDAIANASVTATCSGRTLSQSVGSTNYLFNSYVVSAGGVSIDGSSITGTPTGAVTINAKFHDPITVAWTKGGTTYSTGDPTTEVKYGTQWKDLDIPTAPGDALLGACATKFMGWSNSMDAEWVKEDHHSAPGTLFTSVSGNETVITEPITFRAVFATAGGSPVEWVLTDIDDLTSSDIFVLAESASEYAMTNDNGTSAAPAGVAITVVSSKITSEVAANMQWNISGNGSDGYVFYPNGSSTTWLYCNTTDDTGSNNNLRVGDGARKLFVLDASGELVTNDTYVDRYIRWYSGGSNFRSYVNKDYGDPVAPKCYKKTGGVTYSDYATVCCTQYDITLQNSGTVTGGMFAVTDGDNDLTEACDGDALYLEAIAADGYQFDNWEITYTSGGADAWDDVEDTGDATDDEIIINMPAADITVNAVYSCIPTTATVDATSAAGNYGWRYTPGETIDLTCTVSGATPTGYQWQKYVGSVWTDINKATNASAGTARLQIASCTSSDGGSYRCVVTTGTGCSFVSDGGDGYFVRIFTLDGNYSGSSFSENAITWTGEYTGTVTLSLNESSIYEFKVYDNNGKTFGNGTNNYIIQPVNWDCGTGNSNCRLFTGPEGNYTFTLNVQHADDNSPYVNVQVAYPSVTHPAEGYAYVSKWWTCYPHFWDGSGNALTPDGYDPELTTYTTICGDPYWYFPVLATYVNVIVKDNATYASAGNKSDNQTTTNHSGMYLTHDGSWGWHDFEKYTISFAGNGNSGGSMSDVSNICPDDNRTLAENGYTKTGYHFDGWKTNVAVTINTGGDDTNIPANGIVADEATIKGISSDITLTAQWAANTNTPYLVKHYKQNLDGSYPSTPTETDELTGTSDASVTPARKSYTGFTAPAGTTTTISADGSLVVTYNYTRNSYTLTWTTDGDDLTGSYTKGSTKYEASITAPDTPTKTGYTFAGWNNGSGVVTPATTMPAAATTYTATWTANTNTAYTVKHYKQKLDGTYPASPDDTDNLTGTTGASITPDRKSYTGFTAPSGTTTTILADGSRVVEYQYTRNEYNVAVAAKSDVTITATPASGSAIAEESNADVLYEKTVTLNYSSLTSGLTFGGWKVTKTDDASVSVSVSGTGNGATFTMPAYAVNVTAIVYSVGIAWCDPDVTVTGDVHLTSTKDVPVRYSTSGSDNLITISSSDMGSATTMEVAYLNADAADAEVDKDDSPFRFYKADGSSTTEALDLDYEWTTSHPIRYTPSGFGVTNNYKLKLTFKRGDKVLKTINKPIYGRGLPEEFVIAVKKGDQWVALPSNLASTSAQPSIVPQVITVNNTETPTAAAYAPTTTVYKAMSRGNDAHISALRFTTTGTNYLQVSGVDGTYNMWLSGTNSADVQDWQLKSSDLNAYELTIPSTSATKKMGIYNSTYMGYHGSPNNANIYLLPITNKYTDFPATVTEWGQNSVILDVDAQTAASAAIHIEAEAAETASSFGQTKTSVKESNSKYNYTLSFSTMDFSEHKGELLYIDWLDDGDNLIGCSQITIPWIIAENSVMGNIDNVQAHWKDWEVHVLPGKTLEADGNSFSAASNVAKIKTLEIYPGATVKVTSGTLDVTNLVLRNGWSRAGEKAYDVARLYVQSPVPAEDIAGANLTHTNAYSDWYIDYDQYYPIAVPFPVDTTGICYKNSNSKARAGVRLRYYSGELRAANVQENQAANWVEYTWNIGGVSGTMPTHLEPSKGYIMTAKRPTGKAFSIVRMPLTFSNEWAALGEKGVVGETHKDTVYVKAWGNENTPSYAKGWNIIANPYMALHQGALSYDDETDDVIQYANIPDISFKEYDQLPIETTKLKPASAFLIQAPKDGYVTFGAKNRLASAPTYRREVKDESLPTQKAYIVLASDEAEDMMGILVSDKYTSEYELNADLEKLLGDGTSLKTYMQYGDRNMAYVAINEVLAREWIPVTVRIPESGEYTYSLHEASIAGELEGIYLIDYTSGQVTNLIDDSYSFTAEAGTISGRFAINAIIGQRETPTGIDAINAGGDINSDKPFKFIYHDKVFILHRGVIYDSTGKRVREINR